MRWTGLLAVALTLASLLAGCDDNKDGSATTQNATPDNTPEAECRLIKECNDELKRRAEEKHKKLWEGVGETQVPPPNIDVDANSKDDAGKSEQIDQPTQ